jgi:hypothetical protein
MMILRSKDSWKRLGVGKSAFFEKFVFHEGGDKFVHGTKAVPRLRPVPITTRVQGFVDVEIDAVIKGILAERDSGTLPPIHKSRDTAGRFVAKEETETV